MAAGFWGIILGGMLFRHKVSKGEFWSPALLATFVWTVVLVALEVGYFKV
jgi:uncharacterized membrane protein YsdA (DUF1294 family)